VITRFKPLLSAKVFSKDKATTEKNFAMVRYPALGSVKWDGWRMFEYGGRVLCRSMDPPRNKHTQQVMAEMFRDLRERTRLVGLDGEALGGNDPLARNAMQLSTSAFNTIESKPEFIFKVFDSYQFSEEPFEDRLCRVEDAVSKIQSDWPWVQLTPHWRIENATQALEDLARVELDGAEGIMGRDPKGRYKMGRSSMKEGILWALKPYADGECRILSVHEQMHNANEATVNSLGHTKRSGHKENLVPKDTFGYAICQGIDPAWEETFRIGMGPGLTDALRKEIWQNPEKYVGGILKYKYQAIGCVSRPRQPKWMGMRAEEDMS